MLKPNKSHPFSGGGDLVSQTRPIPDGVGRSNGRWQRVQVVTPRTPVPPFRRRKSTTAAPRFERLAPPVDPAAGTVRLSSARCDIAGTTSLGRARLAPDT